jgi:hypothetical protein
MRKICMKKRHYILVIAIILVLSVVLFRRLLIYPPILNHFEQRFERKWGCQVTKRRADVDLLKGSLTFKGVHMKTPEKVASRWELHAQEIFMQIDYRSLISGTIILDKLIVDRIVFRQERKKRPDSKKKDLPPHGIKKEGKDRYVDEKKSGLQGPQGELLIRFLLIRDGYFEFSSHADSGEMKKLKMEHINLSRKAIFLGRRLDGFFRTLFESMNTIGS